jgi:DNA repair exonuclease SbcCD nuclease subunit
MQAFNKIIAFTDIHFGNKANSADFNQDCTDFIDWMIGQAKEHGCESCAFLGDWHHHRNTINVSTLNYTTMNLKKLNDSFEQVYFITGNHDLYYREKRDLHSLPMLNEFPNIKVINNTVKVGETVFMPWLVSEEWKKLKDLKAKYLFGHFEIPGFKLNAQIEMPDHGEVNKTHFKNIDYVFSGHFHRRQVDKNIHYIGNPFGHDYSTVWDFDHGCMILEWDKAPEYINWGDGPRYISFKLSELLQNEEYLTPKTYVKCEIDLDISFEEASAIKEDLLKQYGVREFKLVNPKNTEHTTGSDDVVKFDTIDQIILTELSNIESQTYKLETLIGIYNTL